MQHRIGVFSGTFDPIHQGHIAFAREAAQSCGLDEVVFLPERRPRGKGSVTDTSHRIALIELVTQYDASLRVMNLASEQFTVENTLPELRGAFGDARLTFLIGSDVMRTLYRWEGLDTLLSEVSFAVGMRANDDSGEIVAIIEETEQKYKTSMQYKFIRASGAGIASSKIRNGAVDLSLLHPAQLDYIAEHGLYSQTA